MPLNIPQLVGNLAFYFAQLPRIEPDGSSPCPDAEGAFFRSALAERAVRERMPGVREMLCNEEERAREAEGESDEGYYNRSVEELRDDIEWAERALSNASRKRYPRDPRGPWGITVSEAELPERAVSCPDHFMQHLMDGG